MGRELKRVPLDFEYPLNKDWVGYVNPYTSRVCPCCDGSGYNKATKKIEEEWYRFDLLGSKEERQKIQWCHNLTKEDVESLVAKDRLWEFTRVPINEEQKEELKKEGGYWLSHSNGYIPTPEEVNEWSKETLGHDGFNRCICVRERAKREGVYGVCDKCGGEGELWDTEKEKELHDKWESYDPPVGDGYQLWGNTSEGCPVSPVFESLDDLCFWCEENATTFGHFKTSKEEWKRMLSEGMVEHREGNVVFI